MVLDEAVYLHAYDSVSEARASIGRYLDFYNGRRPHSRKTYKPLSTTARVSHHERESRLMRRSLPRPSSAWMVVRLEYSNGKSKGQLVDPEDVGRMFKTPLMRSANVLSALFHDGVVVTESDNDRIFYSEIFHRLAEKEKNYPSILFVNAQGKHTIHDIIGPLRSFGVPAAGIPDIDILSEGGTNFTNWLSSAQIPQALRHGFGQQRGDLFALFKAIDPKCKAMKSQGIEALKDADKPAAHQFFDFLSEYGIFGVRKGELEAWLPKLGATGKKTDWVMSIIEKMGSDPALPEYKQPAEGDVWDFMRSIVAWIKNPSRKGTT